MIYLKKHIADQGSVLAMCDEELLGRVLEEGKLLIDLDKYAGFYKGELISEEKAQGMVEGEELHTANIVGERSVAIMVGKGFASEDDVRKVSGVPFLQIFRLDL